jgi:hypothetical protein
MNDSRPYKYDVIDIKPERFHALIVYKILPSLLLLDF